MTDSFDIRNCFASLSPSGQHPLRGAGWLLSLCSPAGCMVALSGQLFYSTQIRVKEFTSSSFHSCN